MEPPYPRDMIGYGASPPDPKWPGGARVAVQIVLNYEEGAENCILHGDEASEAFLSESILAQPLRGVRNMNMESVYEYGSRAGFWRLHRMITERGMPITISFAPSAPPRLMICSIAGISDSPPSMPKRLVPMYLTPRNFSKPSDSISLLRMALRPSLVKLISLPSPSIRCCSQLFG